MPETNLNASFNSANSGGNIDQLFDELSDWNHVLKNSDLQKTIDKLEP
ncbi:MAG: hypothetical protein HRU29_02435 [Rhizobiales bacterium]|nr:hypothetical protein [Hyphomicrobiales bacterium]NRB13236.1 hypothetical protein [Hyphomicrobiales bacterium]